MTARPPVPTAPTPPEPPEPPEPPTPPAAPRVPLTPQRRREMTREHLIAAATEVFAREGFYGASLDEVAAAAGFTKGAVYSNFKSKDDLFIAVLEDRMHRQLLEVEALLAEPDGTAGEHIAAVTELVTPMREPLGFVTLYLEFVLYASRNPAARQTLADYNRRSRDIVERIVAAEWRRLGMDPEIAARSLATFSLALFAGLDIDRLIDPASVTEDTVRDAVAFFVAAGYGMGAPPDLR
jgi:AcrR family transcriptional regulator